MNKLQGITRVSFMILVTICFCTSFTYAQGTSYYYPSTSYQATPFFNTSFSPQTSYAGTTTPYSALSTSYYTPNTASIQAAPQNSFYFPNTSSYTSNSSFYQAPATSAVNLASTYTPLASSYNFANSFYQQPTTTPLANITGSYAPIASYAAPASYGTSASYAPIANANASTPGFYLPSINTTPVYSSQAINYYSPPTAPIVPNAPVPIIQATPSNTYISNATYYPAAGIVIDIEGDYVGEWESTLLGEDGDIKKCDINQDGIFIDGGMKLKEFTISAKEPEFTGEINGNAVIMNLELLDSVSAVFVGEIFVEPNGDIVISGTYTVMSVFNGAMLDQGIFKLEED